MNKKMSRIIDKLSWIAMTITAVTILVLIFLTLFGIISW